MTILLNFETPAPNKKGFFFQKILKIEDFDLLTITGVYGSPRAIQKWV